MYVPGCWILCFQKIDGRAIVNRVFQQKIALNLVSFNDSSLISCGASGHDEHAISNLDGSYVETRIVVLFSSFRLLSRQRAVDRVDALPEIRLAILHEEELIGPRNSVYRLARYANFLPSPFKSWIDKAFVPIGGKIADRYTGRQHQKSDNREKMSFHIWHSLVRVGHETVSDAPDRLKVTRARGIVLDVAPRTHDEVVDRARIGVVAQAPHLFEDRFARHRTTLTLHEITKQGASISVSGIRLS